MNENSSGFTHIIIVVIILGIFLLLGYLIFNNGLLTSTANKSSTTQINSNISPNVPPIENSYTSTTTGLSLTYPSNWQKTDEQPPLHSSYNEYFVVTSPDYVENTVPLEQNVLSGYKLVIRSEDNTEGFTLNDFANPETALPQLVTDREQFMIDGIEVVTYKFYDEDDSLISLATIDNNNQLVGISIDFAKDDLVNAQEMFNQVVSSISFTN